MTSFPNPQPCPSANFRPVADWSGRLVFERENRRENGAVLMILHNVPSGEYSEWVGKAVEVAWATSSSKEVKDYVDFLTTDVTFQGEAKKSVEAGRIHPQRLDGLKAVGPLESLAGPRPENSIHVFLDPSSVVQILPVESDSTIQGKILISQPPTQLRGQQKCLVKFLGKVEEEDELYRVQHYNSATKSFEGGSIEVVRVPTVPKNGRGLRASTAVNIENSPLNPIGWYLYGHWATNNTSNETALEGSMFVVEAWEPRRGLQVEESPDQVITGHARTQRALSDTIWKGARYKKGQVESFFLDPSQNTPEAPPKGSGWVEGDQFLVVHLFGGIGGTVVNEENAFGIIPGHFAFGNATIVKDPFTDELQFQIIHRQVYAHNGQGIISGPNLWSSYCGDLERGWFGTRPISDIMIKLDCITQEYDLGGETTICPLNEMIRELNEMGARYRTGDGDGSALVSSAHSCVQDSNQALFSALHETQRRFQGAKAKEWIEAHPEDPQSQNIKKLKAIFQDLTDYLTPMGVRKDWTETAKGLKGTDTSQGLILSLVETMRTWRTVVPRRAHDRLAEIFLDHGAKLWFIRTNQIGGNDPGIIPLAPARAFDYEDNRKDPSREEPGSIGCGW